MRAAGFRAASSNSVREGLATAEDFATEELELVVLSFISDPCPSQVQELTDAAARLLLTTAGPLRLGYPGLFFFHQGFPEATLPQINMEAHREPYIEDSSLIRAPSPLPC